MEWDDLNDPDPECQVFLKHYAKVVRMNKDKNVEDKPTFGESGRYSSKELRDSFHAFPNEIDLRIDDEPEPERSFEIEKGSTEHITLKDLQIVELKSRHMQQLQKHREAETKWEQLYGELMSKIRDLEEENRQIKYLFAKGRESSPEYEDKDGLSNLHQRVKEQSMFLNKLQRIIDEQNQMKLKLQTVLHQQKNEIEITRNSASQETENLLNEKKKLEKENSLLREKYLQSKSSFEEQMSLLSGNFRLAKAKILSQDKSITKLKEFLEKAITKYKEREEKAKVRFEEIVGNFKEKQNKIVEERDEARKEQNILEDKVNRVIDELNIKNQKIDSLENYILLNETENTRIQKQKLKENEAKKKAKRIIKKPLEKENLYNNELIIAPSDIAKKSNSSNVQNSNNSALINRFLEVQEQLKMERTKNAILESKLENVFKTQVVDRSLLLKLLHRVKAISKSVKEAKNENGNDLFQQSIGSEGIYNLIKIDEEEEVEGTAKDLVEITLGDVRDIMDIIMEKFSETLGEGCATQ